jgi:riboflavin synthase
MFTGIVREVGRVVSQGGGRLVVSAPQTSGSVAAGSSVCVSGVCLTVAEKSGHALVFDVMPETMRKTTLGGKHAGDAVNVESSLRAGDELGGHFVYGHADGVGVVTAVEKEGDAVLVTIQPPQEIMKFFAPQGSVAIDGVSLTIARLAEDVIMVSLVPYTLSRTTLEFLKKGDTVNLECDMLARIMKHES